MKTAIIVGGVVAVALGGLYFFYNRSSGPRPGAPAGQHAFGNPGGHPANVGGGGQTSNDVLNYTEAGATAVKALDVIGGWFSSDKQDAPDGSELAGSSDASTVTYAIDPYAGQGAET